MTDENFNPVLHLLEKHRYTSFSDLKSGLRQLKKEVKRNDQAPVQFMRDNLDAFLQCYDTLSDILVCVCVCVCGGGGSDLMVISWVVGGTY